MGMPVQSESGFQLEGTAPEAYETYLVPTLFAPCAKRLLEVVGVRAGARVVDVACGTGIVGRQAGQLVGSSAAVTGVDVNPAMVDVAARLGPGIDWTVGDAASLPVDDGTVDAWCCQQGLQFVPARAAVLVEARRVLVHGGRIGVAVWCGAADNPAFDAFADALWRPRRWPTWSTGCRRKRGNAWLSRSNVGWTTSPTTRVSWRRCRPG
jgi:ubiquinone/menaquinone biosynthesis C-methylase UbiE